MKAEWSLTDNGRTRERIISDLKADNIPVVVYGTGKFGKATAEYVISHDIPVSYFLDEEKYWAPGKSVTVCGKVIECLKRTQLLKKSESYNMLLGIIDYSLLCDLRNDFKNCHYVEYLDVFPSHIMKKTFLNENSNVIRDIYEELSDSESKQVLEAYLYARYTGDVEVLSSLVHDSQYLYDWKLLDLCKDDVVIDGGAYTGDSILEMKEYLGELPNRIFAFEPDKNNVEKIALHFSNKELEHINIVAAGLYCRDDIMHFSATGTLGSEISEEAEDTIITQALDMHSEYGNATVIKMDIEGSELEALQGGTSLLQKNRPNLAICIYHKNEDLVTIYKFLRQFGYHFYLRQHSASVEETVLYAIG